MAIKLIDIYNAVSGQAWSMFDGELESQDEFETSMLSSIQKALSTLWCSYPFPFRVVSFLITTISGISEYDMPDGNLNEIKIGNAKKYNIRIANDNYLEFLDDISEVKDEIGTPRYFYIKNDKICLYPVPDKPYDIELEYLTLVIGKNRNGDKIFTLKNEDDYIDIPLKFETLFLNALITKSMVYAIASLEDENFAGYKKQFEEAYKSLIQYCRGVRIQSKIIW